MSIYRRHKKDNYTCIDNHVFKDHSLSMKAKGLLTQIYSLPDDWEYSVKGLSTLFSDGRDAVNNALQELIDHGYIIRTQKQNQAGKFDGYEYDIYEQPQTKSAEKPFPENPLTENPLTDNPNQLNTNILNNKEVNTKEIENIYGGDFFESLPDEPVAEVVDEKEKMFLEFWKLYPKKVDKEGSRRAFKRIKKLKEVFPGIIRAIEIQRQSEQWTEKNGKFIPNPTTYIHQERWMTVNEADELQAYQNELVLQDIQNFNLWRNEDDAQ